MVETDHRKALEALQTSELRFRTLLEGAPDAIVTTDERGLITLLNLQTEVMFGYRREELLGQTVEVLVPEGSRADHVRHRDRYVTDPHTRPMGASLDLLGRRKDGTVFPVEIMLSPVTSPQGMTTIAMIRDVTDRRRIEQELARHREHLEEMVAERTRELEASLDQLRVAERLASIGSIINGVAHEVNNPIGVITLKARNLQFSYRDKMPERVSAELGKIIEQCERLNRLTRSLLDFSRASKGEKAPVDLRVPIQRALTLIRHSNRPDGVSLEEFHQEGLPKVLANSDEMEQLLINLLTNAIDAMPQGGRLTVSTACEQVALADGRPGVSIAVEDTGLGMPPEVRERIFEPFFSTKEGGRGTGLGLAICLNLVRNHQGEIRVDSEPGRGTRMEVRLPVLGAGTEAVPAAPPGGRILVVDDEEGIREAVAETLSRLDGVEVVVEGTGQAAAERLRTEHFDVVVTDIRIPDLDGLQLLGIARERDPAVQVLVHTGFPTVDTAIESMKRGAADYMTKPFLPEELLERVERLLERRRLHLRLGTLHRGIAKDTGKP